MSIVLLAVIVALLALVGLCGIVVPALPGSPTVGVAALVWAIWGSSSWGWIAFGVAAVLLAIGMSASLLLTKRDLGRKEIPQWPILVGVACGIVGAFVLPALGLPIGFAIGLFCAELVRVKNLGGALATSGTAIKAIGIGMMVELACAMAATSVVATSVLFALF